MLSASPAALAIPGLWSNFLLAFYLTDQILITRRQNQDQTCIVQWWPPHHFTQWLQPLEPSGLRTATVFDSIHESMKPNESRFAGSLQWQGS